MNHNGKPAIVISPIEGGEQMEEITIQILKTKIKYAQNDIHLGNIADGDAFFDTLIGQHKE